MWPKDREGGPIPFFVVFVNLFRQMPGANKMASVIFNDLVTSQHALGSIGRVSGLASS